MRPYTEREEKLGSVVVKAMSAANTWIYRLTGGKIGGTFLRGAPVLLLTTIGRKSGQPRVAPLLYLEDGGNWIIVASKGGMSKHPLWFHNLEANPDAEIEIGRRKIPVRARRATAEEKKALWPRLVAMYRDYDSYQQRTSRDIPVLMLSPR
ncbi:MAG TPA: nitroreductase family deazaflavin-dependent oxidoreductase [Terriglobales bacterium]|nr:nitroreductase family deazaflavin-dependent oxidoreductase [Terriglobales bacterium]